MAIFRARAALLLLCEARHQPQLPLRRQLGLVTLSSMPGGVAGTRVRPSPARFGYLSRTRAAKDSQRVLAAVQQAPHRSFSYVPWPHEFTDPNFGELRKSRLHCAAWRQIADGSLHRRRPYRRKTKMLPKPSMVPSNPNSDVVARIHEILGSDATSANASLKGSHWLHS